MKVPKGAPLDLKPLIASAAAFEAAGEKLDARLAQRLKAGDLNAALEQKINEQMKKVDRNWLDPEGIPGRPWFRQMLYAPKETYADEELPGVTEAVESKGWTLAREQAKILRHALEKNTALVNEMVRELAAGTSSRSAM